MLRTESMEVPEIALFQIYRGKTNYKAQKKAIVDFEFGTEAFMSANFAYGHEKLTWEALTTKTEKKAPHLMVQTDGSVANVENGIKSLGEQLAELSLIIKKTNLGRLRRLATFTDITFTLSVRCQDMERTGAPKICTGIPSALTGARWVTPRRLIGVPSLTRSEGKRGC